jgi:hypothetical protein
VEIGIAKDGSGVGGKRDHAIAANLSLIILLAALGALQSLKQR